MVIISSSGIKILSLLNSRGFCSDIIIIIAHKQGNKEKTAFDIRHSFIQKLVPKCKVGLLVEFWNNYIKIPFLMQSHLNNKQTSTKVTLLTAALTSIFHSPKTVWSDNCRSPDMTPKFQQSTSHLKLMNIHVLKITTFDNL